MHCIACTVQGLGGWSLFMFIPVSCCVFLSVHNSYVPFPAKYTRNTVRMIHVFLRIKESLKRMGGGSSALWGSFADVEYSFLIFLLRRR